MPSVLQIQRLGFHSLRRAAALLVATCMLVTSLAAAEPTRARVRIQPASPANETSSSAVQAASAVTPLSLGPVVKAASLALHQEDPPAPPQDVPPGPMPQAPAVEPLSPSDQLRQMQAGGDTPPQPGMDARGHLSDQDDAYFENLSPMERDLLYEGKLPREFGIGHTYRHQVPGGSAAPPENLAQKVFSQEPVEDFPYGYQRDWDPTVALWEAPSFYHRPLYFEEVNLERYGHRQVHLQPVHSAAHFFANTIALPYKMLVHHPCERIYTLGHYRPGDCNPHDHHGLPPVCR